MRLIAYYHRLDANVMRRVVGPISVLSARGHSTFYNHLMDPAQMASGNFQLVILPNWSWDGTLPQINGHYCYDLSDAALLQDDRALHVLQQCQSAMVPHPTLAKLVKPFCHDVWVQPTLVHAEWLYQIGQQKPKMPVVACVGTYDWSLIIEPLLESLKEFQQVMVMTTDPTLYEQLPEKRRAFVQPDTQLYPKLIRSSYLALFPGERRELDDGPIHEFNLLGVPVIAGPAWNSEVEHGKTGFVASSPEAFRKAFRVMTGNDAARVRLGTAAQAAARQHTAVRGADGWQRTVAKCCPTAAPVSTLK